MPSNNDSKIWVGCSGFGPRRPARRHFQDLSAVELQQPFVYPPRPSSLKKLRQQAPKKFGFVTRAWQLTTHEPSSPSYKQLPRDFDQPLNGAGHFRDSEPVQLGLTRSLEIAEILDAIGLLFESPTSFTPSATNRRAMTRFFERCERGRLLLWHPLGLWAPDEVHIICRDLGLVPCWDPFVDDENGVPPPVLDSDAVYLRPLGLGGTRRYNDTQLRWLSSQLSNHRGPALCVFGSPHNYDDAVKLQQLVSP